MHHPSMANASSIPSSSKGLRKGPWAEDEDLLLRKCIEKHGAGKWGQVPLRAGLNRCRKSCRLRWLNYLRPNIKRGAFEEDEVDLITRMHKLLGNRQVVYIYISVWSLIAGRVPGRTANDIKNFFNTHLNKKGSSKHSDSKNRQRKHRRPRPNIDDTHMAVTKVLRPQPGIFSETSQWIINKESTPISGMKNDNMNNNLKTTTTGLPSLDDSNDHEDQLTRDWLKEAGDYLNNDLYLGDDLWRMLGEYQDGQYFTI
ncbi:hypothetical protein MKW92_006789 [Papaver armeniacum]|nr:hypothetical protein MKW92_006789 [Papaver armeniacum]